MARLPFSFLTFPFLSHWLLASDLSTTSTHPYPYSSQSAHRLTAQPSTDRCKLFR